MRTLPEFFAQSVETIHQVAKNEADPAVINESLIKLNRVMVLRHSPKEPAMRKVLP
jgi:hypothetical protein